MALAPATFAPHAYGMPLCADLRIGSSYRWIATEIHSLQTIERVADSSVCVHPSHSCENKSTRAFVKRSPRGDNPREPQGPPPGTPSGRVKASKDRSEARVDTRRLPGRNRGTEGPTVASSRTISRVGATALSGSGVDSTFPPDPPDPK